MNVLYIPFLTVLFLCSQSLTAQSLTENQSKYWKYRERLKKEFLVIGEGQGMSLPAESLERDGIRVRFADATVYLGWYIGTLSTEYYLSDQGAYLRVEDGNNIDKDETLRELYYALKTFERLDANAEPFFNKSAEQDLNGFFIRDDVPKKMIADFNVKHLDSDFTAGIERQHNEVSQDQVYHMLMGLMCVKRLIPKTIEVEGENLHDLAIKQGERMIQWMKINNWRVVNPEVTKKNGRPKTVFVGHQAYIFSKGINRILYHLTDGAQGEKKKNLSPLYSMYWGTTRTGANPTYASNDNRHMALTVATSGNGWKRNTFKKLVKRSKPHNWYAYPLMNLMLFPENRHKDKNVQEVLSESLTLLNNAPAEGPVCTYPEVRAEGWSANHMFLKDKKYQQTCKVYPQNKHWNGLDYMLFYNLYLIEKNGLIESTKE